MYLLVDLLDLLQRYFPLYAYGFHDPFHDLSDGREYLVFEDSLYYLSEGQVHEHFAGLLLRPPLLLRLLLLKLL